MAHWVLPSLYPKQRDVFFCPARVSVCEAATKAGKSVGALTWLLEGAITTPGTYLWLSPVFPQAEVMFSRTVRMLTRCDPSGSDWGSSKDPLKVWVKGGGTIMFMGSDNTDRIYGPDYMRAVIDEASRVKEEAFVAVRSTLTATRGPLRIIGNVKGRKNWAYRLARKAEGGAKDMRYSRITAIDAVEAGVIEAGEVEEARALLPADAFRELYEAIPSDDAGNPFGISHIEACVAGPDPGPPVIWGVDLAKSTDWTVAIGLAANGRWCRFERWQGPWESTIGRLKSLIGDTRAIVDSTGVGDPIVESLQRELPRVEGFKFSSQSKQRIMEGLAVAFQSRRTTVSDGLWRNETESFEYEYSRTGVRYTAPEGMHDDCVCAHALAVSGILNPASNEVSVVFAGGHEPEDDWF